MPPASGGYNVRVSTAKLSALVVADKSARGRPMQQITDWLERLGLGQYVQAFAENEIDLSVLPHLTDQDLKDIGLPLGPRRKILAAVGKDPIAAQVKPEPSVSSEPKPKEVAERRQVTVMFSDLVGSTALVNFLCD
jgi:hypothetical protein